MDWAVIPVKLCPSIKRVIAEQFYQGELFAGQIFTLRKVVYQAW